MLLELHHKHSLLLPWTSSHRGAVTTGFKSLPFLGIFLSQCPADLNAKTERRKQSSNVTIHGAYKNKAVVTVEKNNN